MAKKMDGPETRGTEMFVCRPLTLAVLCAVLVLAGGVLGSGLGRFLPGPAAKKAGPVSDRTDTPDTPAAGEIPPWGELVTTDLWIERPTEYLAWELETNRPAQWFFDGHAPARVRELMLASGLSASQADLALAPGRVSVTSAGTTVRPGDELVFSLTPPARAALYAAQPRNEANRYIAVPFQYQGSSAVEWLSQSGLDDAEIARFQQLVYPKGRLQCFSDLEVMLRTLPSDRKRLALLKAVSRQPAVFARVRVRPDTDVDKLLGYWTPGARAKDVRPLLESFTRTPDGGLVSLVYLLPPFARERLFTFPAASAGRDDTVMDCHWTAMNFFNEEPDHRFSEPGYMLRQVETNYYTLGQPTQCGDLLLIIRGGTNVLHSAIFLADDLFFTKNGNNVNQPWTVMRRRDLAASYVQDSASDLYFYRHKSR